LAGQHTTSAMGTPEQSTGEFRKHPGDIEYSQTVQSCCFLD